jgi:rubrerythrin
MDIKKIFQYALEREIEGKKFFEDNAGRFGHAAVVGVFKNLAAEEKKHIAFIEAQLKALSGDQGGGVTEDLGATDFFQHGAALEKIDQTVLESFVPALPVLRMAYLIERDFAEFYEMAAGRTEGKPREALTMLAAWERGHEKLFKTLHDRAFEEYAHMPWGG